MTPPTPPTLPAPPVPPTARPEFALGMKLHNEGEHYEAHEAWEAIWQDEANDEYRLFVQGLIQVTSAFHKLFFQKEPVGAGRLMLKGLAKLEPYPDDYLGVALGRFRAGAKACAHVIAKLEPTREGALRFDKALVPLLELAEAPSPST